mgnify:CR=1 FL=1
MAKYKGWKNRYAYLDDYKPGLDGKYVYYGKHYVLEGGQAQWKNYRILIFSAAGILLVLLIITGLLEAGRYWREWYVNVTYGLKVAAAFLILWKSVTLAAEKYPVKTHVYSKSVPWYRPCAVITVITSVLCFIAALICILTVHEGLIMSGCVLEMVLNLITAAAGVILYKQLKKYVWMMDPSEED